MITWEEKIKNILLSTTGDLRELAKIAGEDPATFYRCQDLSMCDLRGQDLRGMDLTGTNIENATWDDATKIDPEFDPRFIFENEYVSFDINRDLNLLVLEFAKDAKYRYEAWAYKFLVDRAISIHRSGRWGYYEEVVVSYPKFSRLIDMKSKSSLLSKTIQMYRYKQEYIHENFGNDRPDVFGWMLAIGAISRKIRFGSKKDLSEVNPLILFKE